jgi:hypothetical protein
LSYGHQEFVKFSLREILGEIRVHLVETESLVNKATALLEIVDQPEPPDDESS